MEKETGSKVQDIMELICISSLHPDQIDPMLTQSVQMAISTTKSNKNADQIVSEVKKKMLNTDFLKKLAQPFDKIFTHEEIKVLIAYYKSDALKKMYKTATETILPIYTAVQDLVSDIIKPSLSLDKVITLTEQNYQKEVKEFSGSSLVEVYSTFCSPCQTLAPIFSEISNDLSDKVKFLKINLNSEMNLAKELQIHSVPTLLFIKDGEIIDRHVGLINKVDLTIKIKERLI